MATNQQDIPGGPQQDPNDLPEGGRQEGERGLLEALDARRDRIQGTLEVDPLEPLPPEQPGFFSSLVEVARGFLPTATAEQRVRAGQTTLRALTGAAEETTEFVAEDLAAPVIKSLRLHKILPGDAEESFVEWYENRSQSDIKFIRGGFRNDLLGAAETPADALVEGMLKFGVGFALGGVGLKALGVTSRLAKFAQSGGGFRKVGAEVARGGLAGAWADLSVFDPVEGNLSSMVEAGPEWLSNPITRALQTDPDDPGWQNRLRNAVEGLLIGGPLDALFSAVAHASARSAARAGRILPEEGQAISSAHIQRAKNSLFDEPITAFGVRETDDGFEITVQPERNRLDNDLPFLEGTDEPLDALAGQRQLDVEVFHGGELTDERNMFFSTTEKGARGYGENVSKVRLTTNRGTSFPTHADAIEFFTGIRKGKQRTVSIERAGQLEDLAMEAAARQGYELIEIRQGVEGGMDYWRPKKARRQVKAESTPPRELDEEGVRRLWPESGDQIRQAEESVNTSINSNRPPAIYKKIAKKAGWEEGATVVEIGGGKFDAGKNFMADEHGVEVLIYDPFARSAEHNAGVISRVANGGADGATIPNVLNVIPEEANQLRVLQQAYNAVRDGGKIRIDVYAGDKSGVGKSTRAGFQHNKELDEYLPLVQKVFPDARLVGGKSGYIEATKLPPIDRQGTQITVPTRVQAERTAAALQYARELSFPKSGPDGFSLPHVKRAGKQQLELLTDDLSVIDDIAENSGLFDIRGVEGPEGLVNHLRDIFDAMPDALKAAGTPIRRLGQIEELADGLFHGVSGAEVQKWAEATFGETARSGLFTVALRGVMKNLQKSLRQTSRVASLNPDNPVLLDTFARQLNQVWDLYVMVSGSGSNLGIALNALKAGERGTRASRALRSQFDDIASSRGLLEEMISKGDPEAVREAGRNLRRVLGDVEAESADELVAAAKGEEARLAREIDEIESQVDRVRQSGEEKAAKAIEQRTPSVPLRAPRIRGREAVTGQTMAQIHELATLLSMTDDIETMVKLAVGPGDSVLKSASEAFELTNRWRINSMLSQPVTQLRNLVGNAFQAAIRPVESIFAGVFTADPKLIADGWDMMVGYTANLNAVWKQSARAFKAGENILDPASGLRGGRKGSIGELGAPENLWEAFNMLQTLPSRTLLFGDEFFQQLNFRGFAQARLARKARELKSLGRLEADVGDFVARNMDLMTTSDGRGLLPEAVEFARRNVFKEVADPDGPISGLVRMLQTSGNPFVRIMFPFIRTQMNIWDEGLSLMPGIGLASRNFQKRFARGGEEAKRALARQAIATGLWTTAAWATLSGRMTGAGPQDPAAAEAWRAAGFQPFSFKIGDRWISYRNLGPLSVTLGVISDITMASGEIDDVGLGRAMANAGVAIMRTIEDTTLLGPIANLGEFLSKDPRQLANSVGRDVGDFAETFFPALIRETFGEDTDTVHRETRTVRDRLISQVPGWGRDREPRRNAFGDVVMKAPGFFNRAFNPFTLHPKDAGNPAAEELVRFGRTMTAPPEKARFGNVEVDLTDRTQWASPETPNPRQSPYDRWLELMGTVEIGGQNFRERVTELINSDFYQNLSEGGQYEPGGEKYNRINMIYRNYLSEAKRQMLEEYPVLATMLQEAGIQQSLEGVGAAGSEDRDPMKLLNTRARGGAPAGPIENAFDVLRELE